ncbi:MAG: hypothetical protein QOI50_5238, partial [Pseudonocardiales bacterium]|nr:hypothetical protein [Pseudonocardiales bacterium]
MSFGDGTPDGSSAYRPRVSPGPPAVGAGLALAVVSAVTFGLSGPFAKALIDAGWSATGTVLVRLGGAAVVLAVILAATRPGVLVAIRRDGFGLLLYGVLAMAVVQIAFFNAVRYLAVPVALLPAAHGVGRTRVAAAQLGGLLLPSCTTGRFYAEKSCLLCSSVTTGRAAPCSVAEYLGDGRGGRGYGGHAEALGHHFRG